MDPNITEEYENTVNVADVNKEVPFSENTMDYSQDNFTVDAQEGSAGFQETGNPYDIQQDANIYNPDEPLQQTEYEQQSTQLVENITEQSYYPAQDNQEQQTYISEEPQIQDPVPADTSIESNTEQTTETTEEVKNENAQESKENYIENTVEKSNITENTVEESNMISADQTDESIDQPAESTEDDDSMKEELENKKPEEEKEETQNENDIEIVPIDDASLTKETLDSSKEIQPEDIVGSSSSHIEIIKEDSITTEVKESDTLEAREDVELIDETTTPDDSTENAEYIEFQTFEESSDAQDEYIFIEGSSSDDVSTKESAPPPEEQKTTEASEEVAPTVTEEVKPKQRKTRKPIHDLPMHLIGHNISKPVENIPNGKSLPKPRIGVKVPCRHLISQIVSKAELEEEIIVRSRAKEQVSGKSGNKFARSLMQRLAKKIVPENEKIHKSKDSHKDHSKSVASSEIKIEQTDHKTQSSNLVSAANTKIQNDDDLLAILEGDGEELPVMPKENQDSEVDDSNLKLLEREIALQQLRELPYHESKERILKPRFLKTPNVSKSEGPKFKTEKSSTPSQPTTPIQKSITPSKSQTPSPKKSSIDLDSPKKPIEVEPQVKVNMVLKTYSRKRKPSEIPEFEMPSKRSAFEDPDANDIYQKSDPLALPSDVYVTKSSRVIKKKVIWDPDDDERNQKGIKPVDTNKTPTSKVMKMSPNVEKIEKQEKKSIGTPVEKTKSETKVSAKPSDKNHSEKISAKKPVIKNKTPKPKRGSEVDRLLMDEGAVKMLYELKSTDDTPTKKKKGIYSVERAEKEIIKKANLLKNDLVQNTSNESPKSLRKKEGPNLILPIGKQPIAILERKMSKDSTRSSVHTPPRSPTFFASQTSMLIRRRSSSSMSSDDTDREELLNKGTKSSKKSDTPRVKKQKKINNEKLNQKEHKESKEDDKNTKELIPKVIKGAQYKSFTMKKSGKHVSIDLNYTNNNYHFTNEVLDELNTALKKLEKDKDCNVVSITSTSKAFCLGLDYSSLVSDNKSDRNDKATQLAENVRDFLLCLLHFPKILVAGIQGECVGVGVTMLSLFDMVIASDTATFRTPYASFGCLGEATFLLMYPNLNSSGLAAELLYANQTLKADEAFRRGLISKLCWPEKYKETLNNFLVSVSKGSRQSLEVTKKQLRINIQDQIEAAIIDEVDILIQHWTSPECQENFSKIEK